MVTPVAVPPSPNVQEYVKGSPSGSLEVLPLKTMAVPTLEGLGDAVNRAVGAWFRTDTVPFAFVVPPRPSLAVSATVNVPRDV